jgi:hypothetical protein
MLKTEQIFPRPPSTYLRRVEAMRWGGGASREAPALRLGLGPMLRNSWILNDSRVGNADAPFADCVRLPITRAAHDS